MRQKSRLRSGTGRGGMTAYTAAPTSSWCTTDVDPAAWLAGGAASHPAEPVLIVSLDIGGQNSGLLMLRARLVQDHRTRFVNEIPQHTRALITRLLEAYCARICPPAARNAVSIDFRLETDHVVIHELKRICGVPGTRRASPVARFRYRHASADWTLDYFFEGGWRRHRTAAIGSSFISLLREFDADPAGHFWGQLDGKSLRWCSARGRCNDCDLRYKQVLGLAAALPPQGAAANHAMTLSVPSARP